MRRPFSAPERLPATFGQASLRELRDADRFYADLTRGPQTGLPGWGGSGAGEALDESAAPAPLPAGVREPFFGDRPDDGWRVLARPHTPVGQLQLRADDLVV